MKLEDHQSGFLPRTLVPLMMLLSKFQQDMYHPNGNLLNAKMIKTNSNHAFVSTEHVKKHLQP